MKSSPGQSLSWRFDVARITLSRLTSLALTTSLAFAAHAQQANDAAYTKRILELTPTHPRYKFITELVDHLPASKTVPTPLQGLGYVPGTIGRLSKSGPIQRYFRDVAATSPRVKVFSLGSTDYGREMVMGVVADEETIRNLDGYRRMARRMADPRGMTAGERAQLIRTAKPIYLITAAIHSPETGSPDMTTELLYRLAVDDSEFYRTIRRNVIVAIIPVFEVDGRDHYVDWYNQHRAMAAANGDTSGTTAGLLGLPYWGRYVAHDNNRDALVAATKLSQNYVKTFLDWRPTVTLDLHESFPFLMMSVGLFNPQYSPINVNEWRTAALHEVNELTRRGLPGVWTGTGVDLWPPNNQMSVADVHNAVGRFYETYTSSGAGCIENVRLSATDTIATQAKPNPPVNGIRWCIRSNHNYQQSGVLLGLKYAADTRQTYVANNIAKNEEVISRAKFGPLHAYLVPRNQPRAAQATDMLNLFRMQGVEVHVVTSDFSTRDGTAKAGDWIIRLDQPTALVPRIALAIQRIDPTSGNQPGEDSGWTLDRLFNVRAIEMRDSSVLSRPMRLLTTDAKVDGSISGTGGTLVVRHVGDWRSAALPFKVGTATVSAADEAFDVSGVRFPAGSWLISDSPGARAAITSLGLSATATGAVSVRQHAITLPRVAIAHSWSNTQEDGWARLALEKAGVPYTYISDQQFKQPGVLDRFDVVVFTNNGGSPASLINGRPKNGPPIPWKRTAATPSLGEVDSTDDVRDGMGMDGVVALRSFVERGGVLIMDGGIVQLPIQMGFTAGVTVVPSRELVARGGIYRADVVERASPITFGYDEGFPVYFSNGPLLHVGAAPVAVAEAEIGGRGGRGGRGGGRGGDGPPVAAPPGGMTPGEARVVVRFNASVDSLLVSGQLLGGEELAGKSAVVDAPLGRGHVILFAPRPYWRHAPQGSWALAINAIVHWNSLTRGP
jgi:hypothetical protein